MYPAEIEKFWLDAVPEMGTIARNISILQEAGYSLVAAFTLPEKCWTDTYFIPQKAIQKPFLEKHAGNKTAEAFVEYMKRSCIKNTNSTMDMFFILAKN